MMIRSEQDSATVTPTIRIVIADDHSIVREGLTYILNAEKDFQVVGGADNGQDAITLVRELQPDVVLMDLQMPQLDGVEAIRRLLLENASVKVIILTTYATDEYLFDGIRAGAKGYLLKDVPKDELCRAIRVVAQRQALVQTSITQRVFTLLAQGGPRSSDVGLTDREIAVLHLMARGDRNKEIAQKLNLSESTVKGYVATILQKCHVTDRTQAAMYAVQKGIITLE